MKYALLEDQVVQTWAEREVRRVELRPWLKCWEGRKESEGALFQEGLRALTIASSLTAARERF